ncbi:MAG TPA: hypothetical protein VGH54_21675 [Mycobacterium sp.]|jgi:hypothetical protein|uniref:hypothetical protein n=1 Tax=Mycobacterium sp. TaxID=1785 RepID=UPI002F4141BD
MGHREVKRVPLDFNWPRGEVWEGFLLPEWLHEAKCPDCEHGYSPHAERLHALWYGYVPFDPESTGSVPLQPWTPAVRAFAERNIARDPEFYGAVSRTDRLRTSARDAHAAGVLDDAGLEDRLSRIAFMERQDDDDYINPADAAIAREAARLSKMWNGQWCHHLSQDDVNALVGRGRLMDFTHTWSREGGWQKKDPAVVPTAAQVNEWSLSGFGHDSINAGIAVSARCEREGFADRCPTCGGHGTTEAYEGQRAEAEAWEPAEPPAGDGWQLWETTTEGSPKSPVFATAEELAAWCEGNATAFADIRWTREEWLRSFTGGDTGSDTLMVSDSAGVRTLGPQP